MWFIWPALILLSLLLVYIWYSYFYEPYQIFKRLGIPGPPPEVFFGSYKKLAKFEGGVAGLASQRYLATNYGSICGYYIGYHPYLMVTDPDVLREVLVKKFDHFRSRGVNPVIKFGNTPTLIDSDGEVWKKLRHAISPTFSARKLKMMESLMSRPIDRFLARVKDASSTSTSVDVNSWFSELVTENLLAVFFGLATDVQGDEDGQRLVKCINDSFNATKTGGRLDIYRGRVFNSAFPFLLPLVRAAIQRSAIGRSLANVCAVSSKIVKERRKSKLSHTDFLQQIIDARLSPDEVTSQVISMMFSGNETVTSALTSAAYLLAITPALQDTLVEEIVEYFRENPTSTLNDALDLRYLDMVVKEVLRFYPPFTLTVQMAAETKDLPKLFAKILVVGDSGTGKTCIVNRYSKGSYRVDTKATVGTDFTLKTIEVENRSVTLQIWDTAGQERYRTMTTVFYRGAQAGVIVFDLTNQESFFHLKSWLDTMKSEITDNSNVRIPFVIVGNKLDVEDGREVRRERAEEWCKSNGNLLYFETSARNNTNIDEAFLGVAQEVIKAENQASQEINSNSNRIELVDEPRQSNCTC